MERYRKKHVTFECEQLTVAREINKTTHTLRGEIGDWVLTASTDGEVFFCKPELFEQIYEPACHKVMD